ncbi:MAG: hypothetical protein II045_03835 [Oscillospiraceae bacterium]|nr:hypothetical protein [Oscillospiraceae bacterium]MBQ2177987.1 hypothetical protein [Oscillospiraceae bacterium]
MKEEMRTFGYLCPVCHKSVIAGRSTFALSASGAVISCECGKSSLSVDSDGRRFRLSVPCGLCGEEHTAECDSEQLLRGEGIGLACPQTKALCCFIGEDYAVEREMEQLSLTAAKQREQGEGEDVFLDNVIMYEVLSELKEIAARDHGITCRCGSERYRMEVRHTYVDLVCSDCGARLRIPAATDEDLDRLCCHVKLQIKGK